MAIPDALPRAPCSTYSEIPQATLLTRDVVLVVWDLPQSARKPVPFSVVEGGRSITPNASLRLPRTDGGARMLWALRRPEHDIEISLTAEPGGRTIDVPIRSGSLEPMHAPDLVLDVDGASCVALVSTLLNVWGPLFRIQRSREFVRLLRALLLRLAPTPVTATAIANCGDEFVLLQTSLSREFRRIDAAYELSHDCATRLSAKVHRANDNTVARGSLHLLLSRQVARSEDALVVIIGSSGLSVRRIEASHASLPSIMRWLSRHDQVSPTLREHIIIELSKLSDVARATALETQLRAPLQPRRVVGQALTPTGEIVDALSTAAGTLVTGWYSDPSHLVAGIASLGTEKQDLAGEMFRFPVTVSDPRGGGRLAATGFAALAQPHGGAVPLLQPRYMLTLKSGSRHLLVPPLQPADPAIARANALRAVPPEHVGDDVLARIIAPVISALHARAGAAVGPPSAHKIGTLLPRPKVSVVIPLYRVLDFLRFQVAAFAADPWFRRNAELIFVLDSPDQAAEVQHLLGGLYLIYGMPLLLLVMERNGGYARACNTGATFARGEALAMVNSDVIPIASGWLQELVSRLGGPRRVGAVGPKLLFEDGSIQHAGMYFATDHRRRWLNHHFYKGMPRYYAPAIEERVVPAVTGACLVMPRLLFEQVSGFTEDYVIGDYEDSDLCLKITAANRRIHYAAEVELYHLERKSMSVNADYMRGIAWQYNCALHTERWGGLIGEIAAQGQRRRRERRANP